MWARLSFCLYNLLRMFLDTPQHAKDTLACPASVCAYPAFQGRLGPTKVVLELLST